jgi:phospholipase/lecithinase/hemolysin
MPFRNFMPFAALVAIGMAVSAPLAQADSFSSVIVYGDSLSDNGNLFAVSGFPPPPYYQGRLSNGPVAVEQLASQLGVPLHDFAYAGATTGIGNYSDGGTQTSAGLFGLPGMKVELASSASLLATPIVPTSLFVVWGGANDFTIGGSAPVAVQNVDTIVASLLSVGATHILVPGLPDLGLTPEYMGVAAATAYSQQFNSLLQASLPAGATYVDTFNLLRQVHDNPQAYGLANVTDPCFTGTSLCSNPNQYLFWDDIHPTTAADAIVASQFLGSVTQTPEPSSLLLMASGLTGFVAVIRRGRSVRT